MVRRVSIPHETVGGQAAHFVPIEFCDRVDAVKVLHEVLGVVLERLERSLAVTSTKKMAARQ
jgi:hypothetical protein